ncbi:transcription-repair-coupling factor [Virgibacillus pantothenticus]|uniref:transcription-repair coupling factor n=1 Tax=Virgibacillus TaxID=84406 RepID=UPI00090AD88E|nr:MULTISPECIES: transcription-repair coupling factor [Virgibacillus]API92319.1 transcription-repair coupling factor [Virgibacillus sp. 6R]MBS7427081.1 transcription-repair coupling factor [Virgibacillus sp. 19R1-5]MBU8568142.1 transcription-repair coupling factor [Virgibacillus pantothenticus]MBU8602154.1 transcription-repair coupling factor [Virgibacillus pantothenticus]MBU8636357.1 transcription-repair coupling factor [Virgibacillus pantothenticus]
MKGIQTYLQKKEDIQSIINGVLAGMDEQLVAGLSGSARGLLVSVIRGEINKPVLLVTHQLVQAQQLYDDLVGFVGEEDVHLYPVNELIASEIAIASPELRSQRIESLTAWSQKKSGILIAPVAALKRILPPPAYWGKYQLPFKLGNEIDVDHYLTSLIDMGYDRVSMVTSPGEFSKRGGIIDIYPITEKHPIRIELFDEEIDSIRYFDAETQRSLDKLQELTVGPATELLLTESDIYAAGERLEEALANTLKTLKTQEAKETLAEVVQRDVERLKNLEHFPEMYKYIGYLYNTPASLLDYLPADGQIILDEMSRIQETALHLDTEEADWYSNLLASYQMVKNSFFSFDWHAIWERMKQPRLYMSVFLRHIPNTQPQNIVNLSSRPMQEFHGQMHLFKNELNRWEKGDYSVVVLAPDQQRAEKIHSIFMDYDIEFGIAKYLQLPVDKPTIAVGNISSGVELPMHKLVLVTEQELFKKRAKRTRKQQKISNAERIKDYQELKVGDYVVHANHGIGKYLGIETLKVNDLHKDYMLIKYSGDDKLFVPIDQIDQVQKFVGSEGKEPKLYKLGGSEWKKVKRKVQSSVEDIADDLIKLYAEREAKKGYAFSEDTEMQREFEALFPYQETEDQLRCIEEIKQDMERERPMDRLLCGDVGYGKTEVAIRAAFKAIADGKQVALLVPTTILAQQHFETIRERFQDYPITIGLLSRFRTRKQQKETLDGLRKGTVDIVIGTHRILSKDVQYHDLGLLIVDEEQRFGVKHKEKIKQLKTNVDVLTLTATPIPRTLHMSMLGVRDLSVIETPPENRFPIQTYVMEYNPIFVREAIEREMARGGQVFFLHNRVENIEEVARELGTHIDARIAVAHGQMNESELENIIFAFLEGEFDVLVSTTIIETGVDIPNVNTLIVNDADRMGLSQLYQLRGRVGRSNRVAYAYFTYRKDKVLTEVAEKRLQAIKEFTELGSGFKIAMRDLSIRGAGNLLGAQQHGFIDSVGFDMYSQMLKEAIDVRKEGKEVKDVKPFDPELTLAIDAYIPDEYIHDEKQKVDIYKQFQSMETKEDAADLHDELIDRFGDYPEEVSHLFTVATLKMLAKRERITSITEKNNKMEVLVDEKRSQQIDGAKLFEMANEYGRDVQLGTENNKLKLVFKYTSRTKQQCYKTVEEFIDKLKYVNRS